jgi:hypothetical protein
MLRFPRRRAPWLTARYWFFNSLLEQCQNDIPIAIVVSVWERYLAGIPIEAGRLSHTYMLLRPNGTYFRQMLYPASRFQHPQLTSPVR